MYELKVTCASEYECLLLTYCNATYTGNYTGHWFDTHTGQDVGTTSVTCNNQSLMDDIPSFTEDIAVYYTY